VAETNNRAKINRNPIRPIDHPKRHNRRRGPDD